MMYRLENAIDFFPLPVAQAALCPPSVSHFPFYGSPLSFLVEASCLPSGFHGGGLWACKAELPSSSLMGFAPVQRSSSSLEMM